MELFRPDDPLAHPVRRQIFDYVRDHPGAYLGELDKVLGHGWGTLHHHVRVLARADLLTEEREGRRRRFFTPGSVDRRHRPMVAALANEALHRVYDVIDAHPGIHQSALAEELGISRAAVRKHLRRLEKVGLIESHRVGRELDYDIVEHLIDDDLIEQARRADAESVSSRTPSDFWDHA